MENAWNTKWNNNLRPMYVKEILLEHTDETHFISVGDIIEILKSSYNVTACRQTIYDDIDMLIKAGFDIEDVNGKNNRHQYHVLSREFEIAELLVTIGAVKSVRTLPAKKNMNLVTKLSRLAGPSADFLMLNTINDESPKSDNNQVYYIIDLTIYECLIHNRHRIHFKHPLIKNNAGDRSHLHCCFALGLHIVATLSNCLQFFRELNRHLLDILNSLYRCDCHRDNLLSILFG